VAPPGPTNGRGRREQARGPLRRTKIVATLGPASADEAILRKMLAAGMDVARLNFSHGTRAGHGRSITLLRRLAAETGTPLAILQDLLGPKIRVGRLAHPVALVEGKEVVLTTRRVVGNESRIPIAFPRLPRLVRPGERILMKDGTIELEVIRSRAPDISCRVVRGGTLGEHQGVNLPGVRIRGAALTPKDVADLRFGLRHGVDYVALSFVRSASDLRHARRIMKRLGRAVPLVAKLEKAEAIAHLDAIIAEADAVMVARGDLGVEVSMELVPVLQKKIIRAANERGIPVITATQMLESMVHQERPTRAETSDVANAILDGTDAVMLSAETAAGEYPVQAVEVMSRIALAAEAAPEHSPTARRPVRPTALHALAEAAYTLAGDARVTLIVTLTTSGLSARLLSQLRPPAPVLACTEDDSVARLLVLYWGVRGLVVPFPRTTEEMIRVLDRELVRRGLARLGDALVLMGSVPLSAHGRTNFLQIHHIGKASRDQAAPPGSDRGGERGSPPERPAEDRWEDL
jgi:pyruvate kinase